MLLLDVNLLGLEAISGSVSLLTMVMVENALAKLSGLAHGAGGVFRVSTKETDITFL